MTPPSPSTNHPELLNASAAKALDPKKSQGFSSLLAVKRVSEKNTSRGTPMLFVELCDKTGGFTLSVFDNDPYFQFFKTQAMEGSVVLFTGMTSYYQDRFSPKIVEVRKLESEELSQYPCEDLVPSSVESADALWKEFQSHVAKINNPKLRETVEYVIGPIEEAFKTSPAAISVHHAYRHGLLEHTVHVLRVVDSLLALYPEIHADLARAGAAVHDTGKVIEYSQNAFNTHYTRSGTLQGHVILGYQMAHEAGTKAGLNSDLQERLDHIILSHQGLREWGAAAMAATPEAVFVALCDNLDAKMGAVQNALRNAGPNDEFSEEFLKAIESKLLLKPVQE